jgi:hypothetical protein
MSITLFRVTAPLQLLFTAILNVSSRYYFFAYTLSTKRTTTGDSIGAVMPSTAALYSRVLLLLKSNEVTTFQEGM